MKKRLFIVIPAYNEEKTIGKVIEDLHKAGYHSVIVVDDGSKDKTALVAEQTNVIVLKHAVNLGKGAAAKTGCDFALKQGAQILVLIDADGQHEAKDVPRFLKALKGKDVVFGYRDYGRAMPFVYRIGNRLINFATKKLYGIDLRDTQCGFRAMAAKAYQRIRWDANDYAMETEMIANAGKHKLKYSEIPIKTIYSDKYKGTTIIDGARIIFNIILWRLKK